LGDAAGPSASSASPTTTSTPPGNDARRGSRTKGRLLQFKGRGRIEAVESLSFPPPFEVDTIFCYDRVVVVSGAEYRDDVAAAPVTLFRSEDAGATWQADVPKIRSQARPIAFHGPRHIWAVGIGNQLQYRE
jgi:hypothetical protein